MLMTLNNKRQKIATSLLSIFLGSWLLLLCQTCSAFTEAAVHHESSTDISSPCHELDKDKQPTNTNDEHCLGACDCDDLIATVQSEKNSALKDNIKYKANLIAIISPEIILSYHTSPENPDSLFPEHKRKPPFYTYNVLLI